MPVPTLPSLAGLDFASRLVQNVYGLHKQQQDQDRAEAERSRQSMLNVLEAASQSGDVNPADKPVLYKHMFDLIGAKSKDVSAIMPHIQSAFSTPDVPRETSFQHTTEIPESTIDSSMGPVSIPSLSLPPVPTTTRENTPAIRMMNPNEKAANQANAALTQAQILYPQKKKELDEANDRRLALQGAKLSAQDQSKLDQIVLKGGIDATKKLNGYISTYQASGYDPDTARGLAGKQLIREQEANVAAKDAARARDMARVTYLSGHLADMKRRTDLLSRQVDLHVKDIEEKVRHNKASEANVASGKTGAGGAVGRNLKVLMANTKELYTALTPLNNAIVKLETDPLNKDSDGALIPEVQTQVNDLKQRRDGIQAKLDSARRQWLPSMPEPIDGGVTPEVPQVGGAGSSGQNGSGDGKHHYSMAQIQAMIGPNGRTRSGKTLQQLVAELSSHPNVIIDQ